MDFGCSISTCLNLLAPAFDPGVDTCIGGNQICFSGYGLPSGGSTDSHKKQLLPPAWGVADGSDVPDVYQLDDECLLEGGRLLGECALILPLQTG